MKQYTDLTILLDRSGSMNKIKRQMESALDELFYKHRQVPSTRVTLVQFDSENPYEIIYENTPVVEVPKVVIHPRGETPLLDALCRGIDATGRRLADLPHSERPDQVLYAIITDGEENSSKTYKKNDVQQRIAKQQNDYNWAFSFLGSNQEGFNEALSWGIDRGMSLRWCDVNTVDTISDWATKSVAYTSNSAGRRGATASLNYTEDDRKKLGSTTKTK